MGSRVHLHRILMVEDDREFARYERLLLEPRFEVDASKDAGSGLETLRGD